MASGADYSARQVDKLVGLPRAFIRSLTDAGVVHPDSSGGFSLQDLIVLRTAKGLRDARIPPRKIIQSLKNVRATLPGPRHLASVRVRASGGTVEAADGHGTHDALSGQRLLALDESAPAELAPDGPRAPAAARGAAYWCKQAVRLEASDAAAAESAYRRAIDLDPCMSAAYVNLGAMLCEAKRCLEAVALYDQALEHCGQTPLVHFNRGAALEDSGRPALAVDAYRRALELDDTLADAHYNLGVLMERLGDTQASLRYFSAYRRLHRE
ncbi:tetratricopeptide repeat protein [Roseateles chitinivorans]|uniref:tetratricopeptide repeat protein n=1 Tax=Roseateles chitinivorans TaxID=2917965 RepID=UPI003D66DE3C